MNGLRRMEMSRRFMLGAALFALAACSTEDTGQISAFYRQNPGVTGVGQTKVVAAYLLATVTIAK
jgi:hypothetical protein